MLYGLYVNLHEKNAFFMDKRLVVISIILVWMTQKSNTLICCALY